VAVCVQAKSMVRLLPRAGEGGLIALGLDDKLLLDAVVLMSENFRPVCESLCVCVFARKFFTHTHTHTHTHSHTYTHANTHKHKALAFSLSPSLCPPFTLSLSHAHTSYMH